jgi:predicted nucleic-acid-binding protein
VLPASLPAKKKAAKAAEKLFDASARGYLMLWCCQSFWPSVFVLESFYENARGDIASVLGRLISNPGIEISRAVIHLDALDRYRRTKGHFVDCLIASRPNS